MFSKFRFNVNMLSHTGVQQDDHQPLAGTHDDEQPCSCCCCCCCCWNWIHGFSTFRKSCKSFKWNLISFPLMTCIKTDDVLPLYQLNGMQVLPFCAIDIIWPAVWSGDETKEQQYQIPTHIIANRAELSRITFNLFLWHEINNQN